jgi:hypothetical protein
VGNDWWTRCTYHMADREHVHHAGMLAYLVWESTYLYTQVSWDGTGGLTWGMYLVCSGG